MSKYKCNCTNCNEEFMINEQLIHTVQLTGRQYIRCPKCDRIYFEREWIEIPE